jgi:hypothetical protein
MDRGYERLRRRGVPGQREGLKIPLSVLETWNLSVVSVHPWRVFSAMLNVRFFIERRLL